MSIDNRILSYLKEEISRENKNVLETFRKNVNMEYKKLKEFLNSDKFSRSPFNESAGDIPDISRAVLRISNKDDQSLTDNDYDWMRIINIEIERLKNGSLGNKSFKLKSLGVDF